jgi:hypothetical protein
MQDLLMKFVEGQLDLDALFNISAEQNLEIEAEETGELPEREGIDLNLVKRIIRRLILVSVDIKDAAQPAIHSIFTQGTAAIFAYLCDILHIDRGNMETSNRVAKRTFFNLILHAVCLTFAS